MWILFKVLPFFTVYYSLFPFTLCLEAPLTTALTPGASNSDITAWENYVYPVKFQESYRSDSQLSVDSGVPTMEDQLLVMIIPMKVCHTHVCSQVFECTHEMCARS